MSGSSGILSNLIVNLVANIEGFQAGMNTAADSLQKAGQKMSDLGKSWTQNVTAPIIAGAAVIFKVGNDFQDKLGEMAAATGLTEDAANSLGESLLKLAPELGKGPGELIGPLQEIIKAGYQGAEALEILRAAGKASAAGIGDLDSNAQALVTTLKSQAKGTITTAQAMDTLVAAQAAGRTSIGDLGTQLGKLGPAMRETGISTKDTAAALALLTLKSGDTAIAGKQLKAFFEEINNPSKDMVKALAAAGTSAEALRASIAKDGLQKAMANLSTQLGATGQNMGSVFKSTAALDAAMQLSNRSTSALGDTFKRVTGSVGALDRAFATAGGPDRLEKTVALLQVGLVKLAVVVVPIVNKALDALNRGLERAIKWWDGLSDRVKRNVVLVAGIAAAIGPALIAFGTFVSVVGLVVAAFAKFIGVIAFAVKGILSVAGVLFSVLRVAFIAMTGPIGIAIAALAGLVYYFWEEIPAAIQATIAWLKKMGAQIGPAISSAWKYISEGFSSVFKSVKNLVTGVMSDIPGAFKKAFKAASAALKDFWGYLKSIDFGKIGSGMLDGLKSAISGLSSLLSEGIKGAVHLLAEVFAEVVTTIKDLFSDFFNWTTSTIGELWAKLKSWFTGESSSDGSGGTVTADMGPVVALLEQILAAIQNLRFVIDDGGGSEGGTGDGSGGGGGERYGTVGFAVGTDAEAYGLMQSLMDRMIAEDERVGQSWVYAIEEMADALHLVMYSPDATDDEPDADCPCAPWLERILTGVQAIVTNTARTTVESGQEQESGGSSFVDMIRGAFDAAATMVSDFFTWIGDGISSVWESLTSLFESDPADLEPETSGDGSTSPGEVTTPTTADSPGSIVTAVNAATEAIKAMAEDMKKVADHFQIFSLDGLTVDGSVIGDESTSNIENAVTQTITLNLDSRVIAEAIVQHFPDVLTLNGA